MQSPFSRNFSHTDLIIELGGYTGNVVQFQKSGVQTFALDDDGKIAIGNFTPTFQFEARADTGDATARVRALENDAGADATLSLMSRAGNCFLHFGDEADADAGFIQYTSSDVMLIGAGAASRVRVEAGNFRPTVDNAVSLGSSSLKWTEVFAATGTINTSDADAKADIADSDLGLAFVLSVQPRSYRFKDGKRTHYGFIAQEVAEAIEKAGKSTDHFAGYIRGVDEVEESVKGVLGKDGKPATRTRKVVSYGLRYSEMIAPLYAAIKELNAKVEAQQAEIEALGGKKRPRK